MRAATGAAAANLQREKTFDGLGERLTQAPSSPACFAPCTSHACAATSASCDEPHAGGAHALECRPHVRMRRQFGKSAHDPVDIGLACREAVSGQRDRQVRGGTTPISYRRL